MALLGTIWFGLLALLGLSIRPDSPPLEETPVGRSCRGLHVSDGSVSCSNVGYATVCRVFCYGEEQGEFRCTEDEGWSPELPPCARPLRETEDAPPPRDAGCPNDDMCARSCRNRGHSGGKCAGNTCNCWG